MAPVHLHTRGRPSRFSCEAADDLRGSRYVIGAATRGNRRLWRLDVQYSCGSDQCGRDHHPTTMSSTGRNTGEAGVVVANALVPSVVPLLSDELGSCWRSWRPASPSLASKAGMCKHSFLTAKTASYTGPAWLHLAPNGWFDQKLRMKRKNLGMKFGTLHTLTLLHKVYIPCISVAFQRACHSTHWPLGDRNGILER